MTVERRPFRIAAATLSCALVLAACGSTDSDTTAVPEDTGTPAPAVDATATPGAPEPTETRDDSVFSTTELSNLTDGGTASLASLADGDKAMLVWFWAPW